MSIYRALNVDQFSDLGDHLFRRHVASRFRTNKLLMPSDTTNNRHYIYRSYRKTMKKTDSSWGRAGVNLEEAEGCFRANFLVISTVMFIYDSGERRDMSTGESCYGYYLMIPALSSGELRSPHPRLYEDFIMKDLSAIYCKNANVK